MNSLSQATLSSLSRLQAFLLQDPNNGALRADIFEGAIDCGQMALAQEQVEWAQRERPEDPSWLHRQAMLHVAAKQFALAADILNRLIADFPDSTAIRYNLGYALYLQKEYEQGAAILEPLLPLDDDASAALAWSYWLRCMHCLSRLEQGVAAFSGRIEGGARLTPEAWGVASLMAFDLGQLPLAKKWSAYSLNIVPDQMDALVAKGSAALSDQDAATAIAAFSQAVSTNPQDGRSWSGLAFAQMLVADLTAALQAFKQSVTYMPEHLGTWVGYGWCYYVANDLPAARSVLEQAIQQDHNFAESHGSLAVVLASMGEREYALREIKLALKLNPLCLSAQYAQGILNGAIQDQHSFIQFAQKVLAQQPNMERLQNRLTDYQASLPPRRTGH